MNEGLYQLLYRNQKVYIDNKEAIILGFMADGKVCVSVDNSVEYVWRGDIVLESNQNCVR